MQVFIMSASREVERLSTENIKSIICALIYLLMLRPDLPRDKLIILITILETLQNATSMHEAFETCEEPNIENKKDTASFHSDLLRCGARISMGGLFNHVIKSILEIETNTPEEKMAILTFVSILTALPMVSNQRDSDDRIELDEESTTLLP